MPVLHATLLAETVRQDHRPFFLYFRRGNTKNVSFYLPLKKSFE
jgi:hypothetical protein